VEITRERAGEVTVVTPQGDHLDAGNTKEFKRDIAALAEPGAKVVMDLSRLQFVDSSGCGAFIAFLRHVKLAGGDVKLCAVQKPVRSLFELVRMHRGW